MVVLCSNQAALRNRRDGRVLLGRTRLDRDGTQHADAEAEDHVHFIPSWS